MNNRVVAALLLAPIACGLASALMILSGLERLDGAHPSLPAIVFFAGLTFGALFVVFALLPLLLALRRIQKSTRGKLVAGGIVLWVAAVAAYTIVSSQFSWLELPLSALGWFLVPLVLPGLVLVFVFSFVAQGAPERL